MNRIKSSEQACSGANKLTIKICGLTREQDIESVSLAAADQAGFVFAPSRRRLSILQAASLIRKLPDSIEPVGVFADAEPSLIIETIEKAGIRIVQLHGAETEVYIQQLRKLLPSGVKIWKSHSFTIVSDKDTNSVRTGSRQNDSKIELKPAHLLEKSLFSREADLDKFACGLPDAWLLDSKSGSQSGGTGRPFDWREAGQALPQGKKILAGGIHIGNVLEAALIIKPDGVDCSSGVETDGNKDRQRIIDFCNYVRSISLIKEDSKHEFFGTSQHN